MSIKEAWPDLNSNIIHNIVGEVETMLVCIDGLKFMNCYENSKFEIKC